MRVGIGQIHRGVGQIGPELQAWLTSMGDAPQLTSLSLAGQESAAFGCGDGTQPCTSPEEAANMVYAQAASICATEGFESTLEGIPADPGCADNGQAAAAAIYPTVLAWFQGFNPSAWSTDAANPGPAIGAPQPVISAPTTPVVAAPIIAPALVAQPAYSLIDPSYPAPTPVLAAAPPSAAPVALIATSPVTAALPGSSSTSTTTATTASPFAFLTETSIDGIPNWAWIVGGLAVVFILPSLLGGRK
jgi:hypothetical protein